MHGQDVHGRDPVVTVNQVERFRRDLIPGESGETQGSQKPGVADDGNLVESDTTILDAPTVGKYVDLKILLPGQLFGELRSIALRTPHRTEPGADDGNRRLCLNGYCLVPRD